MQTDGNAFFAVFPTAPGAVRTWTSNSGAPTLGPVRIARDQLEVNAGYDHDPRTPSGLAALAKQLGHALGDPLDPYVVRLDGRRRRARFRLVVEPPGESL